MFDEQPEKFTGKNTVFNSFRSSFFFLNIHKKFRVLTNNKKLQDFTCISDRKHPSLNYAISCFINGVFRFLNFHRRFSEALCNRYFNIVRRHMHEQLAAIKRRLSTTENNSKNNQTRTYFRFSVGRFTYYFGFYVPCDSSDCKAPPTFVTKNGSHCWIHWKNRCKLSTPTPRIHTHVMDNVPKKITSKRLGVVYTKEMSFSSRLNKYFVLFKNFERLPTLSKQQIVRFDRLTQNSASNDFKKLLTSHKPHVSFECRHQPTFRLRHHVPSPTVRHNVDPFSYSDSDNGIGCLD